MRNRLTVLTGFVITLAVALTAQTNVAGLWNMTFNTDQGSQSATLQLEQDGEKLMGSIDGEQGALEFEGTISGNKLEWSLEIDAGGQFLEISMSGTVDGDEMTGSADFGGYGGGDWTAKRAQ
ncbi:MAG: hypothetical protein QF681_11570 [Vicinamibacterales bacterium]|jgi:hypothetical protein|nr:hypothetical protein [Vicinamibacterales bacterium]